jgi:hypothetical protein
VRTKTDEHISRNLSVPQTVDRVVADADVNSESVEDHRDSGDLASFLLCLSLQMKWSEFVRIARFSADCHRLQVEDDSHPNLVAHERQKPLNFHETFDWQETARNDSILRRFWEHE